MPIIEKECRFTNAVWYTRFRCEGCSRIFNERVEAEDCEAGHRAVNKASEIARVAKIAEAARSFLKVYDEFDGDPACVGEWLDALETAIDN